jgi:serine/threonine protein kinase
MSWQWRSRSSRLLLSSLLASYIIAIIIYGAKTTTAVAPVKPERVSKAGVSLVTPATSSLIVCAADGSIFTIDALTGMAKGYFGTGRPLVGSSSPSVKPGLDGSIYTLSNDNQIQVLPLTVQQVAQHPVQTCTGTECGVLTGTKHTFLYGLDPATGRLEWTQQFGKTPGGHDRDSNENPSVVILHREDYVVRHISTSTGEELWNVTLGHVSALDFNNLWGAPMEDGPLLPGKQIEKPRPAVDDALEATASMPSIAFGKEGTTVTAIDDKQQVLWRRQLNTVIASVYGVVGNDFVPISVVESPKELVEDSTTALAPFLMPPQSDFMSKQRDLYLKLLWNEVKGMSISKAGESEMIIFQPPPRMDRTSAEFTRLANKATHSPSPVCYGLTIDGVCYETPLLESGRKPQQHAGIYLTWDRLFVAVIFLGLGIRLLIAHNRRMWNKERHRQQRRLSRQDSLHVLEKRDSSLSEPNSVPFAARRTIDINLSRVASLPELATHNITSPGDLMKPWNIEKVDLVRATTMPNATDTSNSSAAGNIDGIPFVKHSRYQSEFREIAPLGKGGFGTVFRCENVLDGRQYAIKKVRISSGEEFSQRLQRVLREVKTLAKLDHPNIVRYYTAWLEAEESGNEKDNDEKEGSNSSIGRCYSVELMTSTQEPSEAVKKNPSPVYDMNNPLGWNGIDLEGSFGSFDDKQSLASQEGSDFGGFHFDHSSGGSWDNSANHDNDDEESSESSSTEDGNELVLLSRSPGDSAATPMASNKRRLSMDLSSDSDTPAANAETHVQASPTTDNVRHTLYIQMHLCSQKTLADFLSNADSRKGSADKDPVDIPLALSLFHQIAEGVKHVHEQGLIHRDLKPSNCFIDDGVVKVGDFGLSRESSDPSRSSENESPETWLGAGEFSAGIGTRAYASPEQMTGSYDSSTDVYSLGIILFELCYPMCTVRFVLC